ncbi:MAG: hypothetical protein AAGF89_00495 [Bacteroidota bacterium]
MSFWDNITNIFRQAEESSPSQPAVHELIERNEAELANYERWKKTLGSKRLLNWLVDQYAIFKSGGRQDQAMGFLDTPSSKGFVIYFHQTQYSREEITHFFHYLKERVQSLNYRSDISDRRVFSRKDWVETIERHYLKPRARYEDVGSINQGFGNIMIELELRNDIPHNLRLRANVYNDAMFAEAGSFGALVMALSGGG